jgi:uncharacterized protein (DUF433 family)
MLARTDISTLITYSTDTDCGHPIIAGTKTSVSRVVTLCKQGAGAEEIARRLSHLHLPRVHASSAYYHGNHDEIEAGLAQAEAEYWRLAELHSRQSAL